MNGLLKRVSMATVKSTTRRGFLSSAARRLVGVGLGAAFLLGGQQLAWASCVQCAGNCNGNCGDGNCGSYPRCSSCPSAYPYCPSGYNYVGCNSCCCGGELYRCDLCSTGTTGCSAVGCACFHDLGFTNCHTC